MIRSFTPFRLAFLLAPLVFLAPVTRAQTNPSPGVTLAPEVTGFDKLFEAVEKLSQADLVGNKTEKLSEAELIQQMRNIASRNKRSLFAFREALKLPIQHPPVRTAEEDFGNYDGFRALAHVLEQEAEVRRIDSNFVGAVNARIDCIEFGVLMTRGGPLRAALAGRDIEIIGRRGIDKLVSRLDNEQTLAAAARLNRIETLRPPFSEAIRQGKIASIALTKEAFDVRNWDEAIEETLKLDGQPFSEDERNTLATIGQSEIAGAITRAFDAALQSADAPYKPQTLRADYELDPWSALLTGPVNSPSLRVDYEAARAQNRLMALSLQLRVSRLQAGRYPETLDTSADPFANGANFKYRREGDSYVLYSVGPNGKDDGGVGLVIPENGQIPPRAAGDLVAPVLPL